MKFIWIVSSQFGDMILYLTPDCDPDLGYENPNFISDILSHYVLPFQEIKFSSPTNFFLVIRKKRLSTSDCALKLGC